VAVCIEGSAAPIDHTHHVFGGGCKKVDSPTTPTSKPEVIAAALDEARQNARLLRVSSALFLKEAKELIDADKVGKTSYQGELIRAVP